MGGDATTGGNSLPIASRIRVCWSEQLPAAMQMMLVSEPPRLLINAAWWRRAASPERRQALETLRLGPRAARSPFQIWGRRPLRAGGFLRQALEALPLEFWDRLVQAP
jgi:hypothetical protein